MKIRKILKSGLALLLAISLLPGLTLNTLAIEENQSAEQQVDEIQADELQVDEITGDEQQVDSIQADELRIKEIQADLDKLSPEDAIIENQLIVVTKDSASLEEAVDISEEDIIIDTLETEEETIATVETTDDLAAKMAEYEADPNVEYVQPNFIYTLQDEVTALASVNDSFVSRQWYLDPGTYISDAWDYAKTQKTVKVAVIDSGVQANHPDLKANISPESYDFVAGTMTMSDSNGHGTHVAGIIAAVANNGVGIAGVSYNAELLCYRVTQKINGEEAADTSTVIRAYAEAVSDGAQVINISLGKYGSDWVMDTVLQSAIITAHNSGIVTVCAAGNGATSQACYPSDYEQCISVVATDEKYVRANFSDYNQYKDIAAPGVNILSTYTENGYAFSSGTSMASPVVAGVICLMLAAKPSLTVNQIKDILYSTATDLGADGRDNYYGYGMVNAKKAVIKAAGVNENIDTGTSAGVNYQTHIQNIGWQMTKMNGDTGGTTGQSYRLEAIKMSLSNTSLSGSIEYKTHIQSIGWQDWKKDEAASGSTGSSRRLEAIRIRLTDEMAKNYDVYYRVHAQSFGWMGWAKNGAPAGTAGYSYRLEAIQVKLVKKGGAAPGSTSNSYNQKTFVQYQTHVQSIGWQGLKYDGATSGTTAQSKRLEGIKINLVSPAYTGNIEYQTHIQNIGWQGWQKNGALSGTTGQSKRLEAIRLRLTGEMAENYDIYYRVHAQSFGWMGWAKNGNAAGTAGYAYRLESIQIRLVVKGGAAPGSTSNAFNSR